MPFLDPEMDRAQRSSCSSHQNPNHVGSCLEPRIVNGAANREMINHLLRERAGGRAWRGFLFVLTEGPQARKLLFARFGNHKSESCADPGTAPTRGLTANRG